MLKNDFVSSSEDMLELACAAAVRDFLRDKRAMRNFLALDENQGLAYEIYDLTSGALFSR